MQFRGLAATGAAAFALLAGLGGCGGDDGEASRDGGQQSAEGKVIGLSMHFLADDYAKAFADTVEKKGREQGLEVRVANANGDAGKQLSDIQSFVTQGVDALIVIPIDEAAIVPAVNTASQAEIPILSASPIPAVDDKLTAVVGPSDFENGRAACEEMAKEIGERGSQVAISTASVKLYRIEQRVKGCEAALDDAGLSVVDRSAGLSPEEGLENAQNLLSAHSELRGIFASFSNLVLGAGNAVERSGRKDVAVSGIDADRAIIKQIADGTVTAVAAQFPREQAQLMTEATVTLLTGGEVVHDQQDKLPTRTVDATNYEQRHNEIWGQPFPAG